MQSKFLAAALLASLIAPAAVTPATAQHRGHPHSHEGAVATAQPGHRHVRHQGHARMLPPAIPSRDPRLDLRPRGQPDFLIHAYLPRFTNAPMYNEPPSHFPRW